MFVSKNRSKKKAHLSDNNTVHPKLKIGKPDNKYEREANRVADTVIRMQPVEEDDLQMQSKEESTKMVPKVPRIRCNPTNAATIRTRSDQALIQRDVLGAAAEALSQPFENLTQPGGSFGGIPNPLASVFDGVVTTSIASASGIGIPSSWWDIVRDYSQTNPTDGVFLLPAIARGPSFWRNGWILNTQPRAAAMTLDDDVFIKGSLPISRFVHELVHVAQYSTMGKVPFLTSYFGVSAATIAKRWAMGQNLNMMQANPFETHAYAIDQRFTSWYNNQSGYPGTASSNTV